MPHAYDRQVIEHLHHHDSDIHDLELQIHAVNLLFFLKKVEGEGIVE